jgi:hypothetical protein
MDSNSKNKKHQSRQGNIIETFKDVGQTTSRDFVSQLFGAQPRRRYSGEILPQEQVTMDEVISGEQEKKRDLQIQLSLERTLRAEEEALKDKKIKELQLTIHALMQELASTSTATTQLSTELQVAAIQAPVNPGIYHVFFIEKLIEYIHGYNKRIENSVVWLQALNKRAAKKGFWSQYKMHGGRRLLSAEDYSQRSAG